MSWGEITDEGLAEVEELIGVPFVDRACSGLKQPRRMRLNILLGYRRR